MSDQKEIEMPEMTSRTKFRAAAIALAALGAVTALVGTAGANRGLPEGGEPVTLDPAQFRTTSDNRYFPLRPGMRWVVRETDKQGARQKVVVTVTDRTKLIADGVTARVVHDVVSEHGQFVEVTDDWFAQDAQGNVWYFGEDTTSYENGKPVSTEGSFEAGVDGAQPGVIMPAEPRRGLKYREEFYAGHAEDRAKVIDLNESVEVPFGRFRHVLETKNTNPLEPGVIEHKFYARGIGQVEAKDLTGAQDHEVLVKFRRG